MTSDLAGSCPFFAHIVSLNLPHTAMSDGCSSNTVSENDVFESNAAEELSSESSADNNGNAGKLFANGTITKKVRSEFCRELFCSNGEEECEGKKL